MMGNFFADHVRGNRFQHFPEAIQQGILLHRKIDTFTDNHEIVRISKRRLHERYGHYDGVIIDIFYDHFLAKNWSSYSQIPLAVFVKNVYQLLQKHFSILPKKTQELLPYMIQYDWLYNYQFEKGIDQVLQGMNRRTKGKSQMHLAIEDLQLLNTELENDFLTFFKDLKNYTSNELATLKKSL
ncbi:ACP phosphodiesterase [Tenacibaculum geojense]|uniref:ACP phosphodiesterase n=1 Tax=Tenacibaculum geojense TaxID=915352 RepID=A0ABW3JWM8_9FLAO